MENTIENNRLIAEFMGRKLTDESILIYHDDWNCLMPVFDKIARIPFEEEDATPYARTFGMLNDEGKIMVRLNRFQLHIADTLIEATYAAVIEYIKWYNSNQPPTINQ